jgi:hypothetical protein
MTSTVRLDTELTDLSSPRPSRKYPVIVCTADLEDRTWLGRKWGVHLVGGADLVMPQERGDGL